MLFCFVCIRVVFVPLTTTNFTAYQLASFKRLAYRLCLQMVLLGIAGFGNTIMFGILGEGPETPFHFSLLLVCGLSLLTILISELINIAFGGTTEDSNISSGPGKNTLEIVDLMHAASSGIAGIA